MGKIYIVDAKRTAIGSMLGTIKSVHPAELGVCVVKNILETTKVNPSNVDELICGNILSAGLGQGVARQISINSGIPFEVPAYSLNMLCGSGMKAIMNGYQSLLLGNGEIIVAGGVESMSYAPYLIPNSSRSGAKMGNFQVVDHMINDALTDAFSKVHMGVTAENIANKYNISRSEQDEFAYNSQQKAIAAINRGEFKDEIVPFVIHTKKGDVVFEQDEFPNTTTNLEKLAKLKPCFVKDGSVTAGSASGINDGAAFVLLASEEAVKKYNLKPLCEIIAVGQGGVDPQIMGMGPVPAIKNALKKANLSLKDIDLVELNEAFAAQSLGVVKELCDEYGMTKEEILNKTNLNGGAIALGHPVGASGARIVVTLLHQMVKSQKELGLASLCIGGGMGTAVVLKLVK